MDTKFNAIMSAEEAKNKTEQYREKAYLSSENFLISYIGGLIDKASSEGKSFCYINTNEGFFPPWLTASKVMEHLASPLYQLGYRAKILGDFRIAIDWEKGNGKECEWDESF